MSYLVAQLLIDDFARNGYKVVAPDLFEGDPAPVAAVDNVRT
jgi:dienelactone hydrolase